MAVSQTWTKTTQYTAVHLPSRANQHFTWKFNIFMAKAWTKIPLKFTKTHHFKLEIQLFFWGRADHLDLSQWRGVPLPAPTFRPQNKPSGSVHAPPPQKKKFSQIYATGQMLFCQPTDSVKALIYIQQHTVLVTLSNHKSQSIYSYTAAQIMDYTSTHPFTQ